MKGKKETRKIEFKISIGQFILTCILFVVIFLFPAFVYDYYQLRLNPPIDNQGNVAGVFTQNDGIDSSTNSQKQEGNVLGLMIDDLTNKKFSLVSVAGIVSVSLAVILFTVLANEEISRRKYASSDL